jgi:hypothetical protein
MRPSPPPNALRNVTKWQRIRARVAAALRGWRVPSDSPVQACRSGRYARLASTGSAENSEPFSSGDLAVLKDVHGLGQLPGAPGAAAEFAQDAPGLEPEHWRARRGIVAGRGRVLAAWKWPPVLITPRSPPSGMRPAASTHVTLQAMPASLISEAKATAWRRYGQAMEIR